MPTASVLENNKPSNSLSKSTFFIDFALAFIITHLPIISVPFNWLETYFHELSHAIMTLLTGGSVSHIELFINGAGLCYSQGGLPVVIAFSGYFGAAMWGFLLFYLATLPSKIKISYACVALIVLLTILFWGRDLLTIIILSCLSLLFFMPLKLGYQKSLTRILRIVALIVMVNALSSPAVLLGFSSTNDAAFLAEQTWIPVFVWVLMWFASGALAIYLSWQRVKSLQ